MGKLIILTGMLASGKSTIADMIEQKSDFIVLKKDAYKEKLVDEIGFTTREENRNISIMAVKKIFIDMENLMKEDKNIVLDANFRKDEIDEIYLIAKKHNYDIRLYVFEGNLEILYERFLKRIPTRHKAHLSIGLQNSFDNFKEYNLQLVNFDINYPYVKIDSTKFDAETIFTNYFC